jgi:hypothetical protein
MKYLAVLFIVSLFSCKAPTLPKHTGYTSRYVPTYCKSASIEFCGVTLFDCENGKNYYCVDTVEQNK